MSILIPNQKIEVRLSGSITKYYEDKGYHIPRYKDKKGRTAVKNGTFISVKVEDLQLGSGCRVLVECDYCGKVYNTVYSDYNSKVVNGIINKVACWDCSQIKLEESNLKQFGVTNALERQECIDKRRKTMIKRYGVEHPNQNKNIIERVKKQTKLSEYDVFSRFEEKDFIPLFEYCDFENAHQHLPYSCKEHPEDIYFITINNIDKVGGCPACAIERTSGENHYNWRGGASRLDQYIRSKLYDWSRETMVKYKYKCAFTGNRFDAIHHLYGLNLIRNEVLDCLGLEIRSDISTYAEVELDNIVGKSMELHKKYGLGITLCEEIHVLFHKLYGYGDNTPEQFDEFKIRFNIGEFDDILTDNKVNKNCV